MNRSHPGKERKREVYSKQWEIEGQRQETTVKEFEVQKEVGWGGSRTKIMSL